MKNFASRVLALILVLSVLLMPMSALAAERGTFKLTIGNFELTVDEQTISLPVYLQIGGGADIEKERGYLTATLQTASQVALGAAVALENEEVDAYLNGMPYGLTMTTEQIVSTLETAMGMSFEDLLAQATSEMASDLTPEMQAAIEKLTATLPALMNESANLQAQTADLSGYYQNVLGATVEVVGEAETATIFDVEVQAVPMTVSMEPTTLTELMNNLGTTVPAMKDFWDAYIELFDLALAESGEEVSFEEIMNMISYSMNGTMKVAEEGYVAELTMTMTANIEGETETVEIPFTMLYLTDEQGWYAASVIDITEDDENMYMTVYVDDWSENGTDYTNCEISMSISNVASETTDTGMVLSFYTEGTEAEGTTYGVDAHIQDYNETVSFGGAYHAYPAELSEEEDSYSGALYVYADDGITTMEFSMDTNLSLGNMPEGELLTFAKSINPLEADEATIEQLGTDAMTVLYQGLGILMSDPDIAALINNFAG